MAGCPSDIRIVLVSVKTNYDINEESAQRDANTARCCSKVEPKIFAPVQTPFAGAWDGPNLIS